MNVPAQLDFRNMIEAFDRTEELCSRRSQRERTAIAVVLVLFAIALVVLPAVGLERLVGYVSGATVIAILVVMVYGGRTHTSSQIVVADAKGRHRIVLGVFPTDEGEVPGLFMIGEDGESSYFCVMGSPEGPSLSFAKPGGDVRLTAFCRDDEVVVTIENHAGTISESLSSPRATLTVGSGSASAVLSTRDEAGSKKEIRWPTHTSELLTAEEARKLSRERRANEDHPSAGE